MHNGREEIGLYADGLSFVPKPIRRRHVYAWSWEPRMLPMLLACVAVAALVVSGAALALTGGNKNAEMSSPVLFEEAKAEVSEAPIAPDQPPPPPYEVFGYTYDAVGSVLTGCLVNITNTRTGDYNLTFSANDTGFYRFNLNNQTNGRELGDIINVTAQKDLAWGWNESEVTEGPYLWIDVHLTAIIPEFPMVVLPVVGILAVFAVVSFRRRHR